MSVSSASDPRHQRPAVTGLDTQHLLYATVKKHRFLAEMAATCLRSSVVGSTAEEAHVRVQLMGGRAQLAHYQPEQQLEVRFPGILSVGQHDRCWSCYG